tara:strand:- start:66 stop:503 length:438 start_codon:yes stop_codon:yes gene_type:complete
MKKIYSKVEPGVLLHLIHTLEDIQNEPDSPTAQLARINVAPNEEFLQLASLRMGAGKTFKPHKHIYKKGKEEVIAQESWVVIKGGVEAILYDLDDSILEIIQLGEGDCSMTFHGGHNYLITKDNTVVYEYKTGPYTGIENDKVFI